MKIICKIMGHKYKPPFGFYEPGTVGFDIGGCERCGHKRRNGLSDEKIKRWCSMWPDEESLLNKLL